MTERQRYPENYEPATAAAARSSTGLESPVIIEGRNLYLAFGDNSVLEDVSFRIREGESLSIVGASGVGKSTILKLVLRLLVPDSGHVLIDGEDINELTFEEVLEVREKMGMVFQAAALFDSLSTFENVAFPLREHMRLPEDEVRERVRHALAMVDLSLDEFGERLPAELSGGQKKRVGIARAIVHQPKILLYDEPTTGLDPVTSRTIVDMIVKLQTELDVTAVVVSHDVKAVMRVSTHIAMLKDRRIIFYGTPDQFANSANPDVREFVD
ncbi:MAG: ATP-binding cassette domain-containing protein [Gemmatimonadota bacterium]|nr:MAG: ATP-binding cassette domain-containing protein [Gemmatimonadota bacterium]